MKKRLTLAVTLASALMAAQAYALPFNLAGGYTGFLQIKYNNWEVLTTPAACISGGGILQDCSIASPNVTNGGDNYGIIKVTSILDESGLNTLWVDGQDGTELTGIFRNLGVKTVTVSGGTAQIDSIGGEWDLYLNPDNALTTISTGNFNGAKTTYTGITGVVGGELFASGIFGTGILATDPTITISGLTNALTLPPRGSSSGYMDVTGGSQGYKFDTNTQNGHDMLLANNFTTQGATGGFNLTSFDPITAKIPTPGTLALLGIGLVGLAVRRRAVA